MVTQAGGKPIFHVEHMKDGTFQLVSQEGDVWGLVIGDAHDALSWCQTLNEVYSAGYHSAWADREDEVRGLRGFRRSVEEALNSGDGSYRP
ncbi:MAG: hypothetical protein WC789_09175 [Lentisphaeria bacterium]